MCLNAAIRVVVGVACVAVLAGCAKQTQGEAADAEVIAAAVDGFAEANSSAPSAIVVFEYLTPEEVAAQTNRLASSASPALYDALLGRTATDDGVDAVAVQAEASRELYFAEKSEIETALDGQWDGFLETHPGADVAVQTSRPGIIGDDAIVSLVAYTGPGGITGFDVVLRWDGTAWSIVEISRTFVV